MKKFFLWKEGVVQTIKRRINKICISLLLCLLASTALSAATETQYYSFYFNKTGEEFLTIVQNPDPPQAVTIVTEDGQMRASISGTGRYDIATLELYVCYAGRKEISISQKYGVLKNDKSDIQYKLYLKDSAGTYHEVTGKSETVTYDAVDTDIGFTKEIVGVAVQIDNQSFASALSGTYADTLTITRTTT